MEALALIAGSLSPWAPGSTGSEWVLMRLQTYKVCCPNPHLLITWNEPTTGEHSLPRNKKEPKRPKLTVMAPDCISRRSPCSVSQSTEAEEEDHCPRSSEGLALSPSAPAPLAQSSLHGPEFFPSALGKQQGLPESKGLNLTLAPTIHT